MFSVVIVQQTFSIMPHVHRGSTYDTRSDSQVPGIRRLVHSLFGGSYSNV